MASVSQSMHKVKSGGSITQQSGVPAMQAMDDIDAAGDVGQVIMEAGIDPERLAADLLRLRDAVAAFDPRATVELTRLDAAGDAAQQGDGAGALTRIQGLGRWVGKLAADIGAEVLAKIIEKQMGP